jgi:hypothetical protein
MSSTPSATSTLVAAALELHKRDLHPFPVDHPDQPKCIGAHSPDNPCDGIRGKHPACKWKTWAVVTTPQMIEDAWKRRGLANIAIDCGSSNLVVLDEDQHGELVRWCADNGITLPPTYEVGTGRGRHLYFHWDHAVQSIGNSEKAFKGYKINVRGDGGLVIGEGSKHESGVIYAGNGKPIADLPQIVADKLLAGTPTLSTDTQSFFAQQNSDPNSTMIAFGERHEKLVEYAGRLRGLGLDSAEAEAAFKKRWLLCEQPDGQIPEAAFHGPHVKYPVTWDQAQDKLASVYNLYAAGTNGQARAPGAPGPVAGSSLLDRLSVDGEWLDQQQFSDLEYAVDGIVRCSIGLRAGAAKRAGTLVCSSDRRRRARASWSPTSVWRWPRGDQRSG